MRNLFSVRFRRMLNAENRAFVDAKYQHLTAHTWFYGSAKPLRTSRFAGMRELYILPANNY